MLVPNLGEDFIPTPEKVKNHVLLLASGVGITPFRSIAYELLERRHHSGKVHLLYSVHGEEDVIYADEWQGLSETYPNFEATIMVRHQAEDAKFCVGNVWDKIPELQNPKDSCAFICGTTNMVKKSVAALEKAGMDRENIVIENFAKQHRRKVGIAYQRDAPVWLRCNPTYRAKVE
jgi:ferredoxin-NADP reductase